MQSGVNPVTLRFLSPSKKQGKEKRNKHVEADPQKQQVVDCGTKGAWKADASETAKCVICDETSACIKKCYDSPLH